VFLVPSFIPCPCPGDFLPSPFPFRRNPLGEGTGRRTPSFRRKGTLWERGKWKKNPPFAPEDALLTPKGGEGGKAHWVKEKEKEERERLERKSHR